MTTPALGFSVSYQGTQGAASWHGRIVASDEDFRRYAKSRVKARLADTDASEPFAAELQGLATTGMATAFVESLLKSLPAEPSWAFGEALAECVLADDESLAVRWPWNSVRDRRTPRASLPGADLVGFCRQGGSVALLFGEVKTSADPSTPPNVMYGSGGMTWQLEAEATRLDVQCTLLLWLRARCILEEDRALYRAAVQRYIQSRGKDIVVVGILLRDTAANEKDLKSRALSLSEKLASPTRAQLTAWYLPTPISEWGVLTEESA